MFIDCVRTLHAMMHLVPGHRIHLMTMKTAVKKDLPSIILLTSSFLSTALEISLIFIRLSIQPQIGVHFRVGHSWRDYIYSPTTLYDGEKPYAIFSLISVLAVKPSPILPDFFISCSEMAALIVRYLLYFLSSFGSDISL